MHDLANHVKKFGERKIKLTLKPKLISSTVAMKRVLCTQKVVAV